jgi:hypothetical protein
MKTFGYICLVALFFALGWAVSVALKGCDVANEALDKTVLNVDKNIYSYEQFYQKASQYEQYRKQLNDAEWRLKGLSQENGDRDPRYGSINAEIEGCRNMMYRIAADYNAMSQVGYQKIWKDKGLPERLGQ